MIHISLSTPHVHRKMVKVRMTFLSSSNNQIVQLSSWRPGRYEMGNFAKNISHVKAFNTSNEKISAHKIAKDQWQIACGNEEQITFEYFYCAAELNAGSTYVNSQMLYVNPVNCIPFLPGRTDEKYTVEILDSYAHLSCGLPHEGNKLFAQNFDELADSPFVASRNIEVLSQEINDVHFYANIFGITNLNFERFWNDVRVYTQLQLNIFGEFPVSKYRYLLHFTPYFMHHGVEHNTSTVIVMGHGENFDREEKYNEILAICSHELFHTWNVKTLRPVEMMPYDFTKENYTQLGYVDEGVTTYYGDLCLRRSGIWNNDLWKISLEKWLNTHHRNYGRYSYSVADSSVDTWLDGYTPGVPWRKVSIYNEGALLSMILDIELIAATNGEKSMDDVMHRMYQQFAKKNIGYSVEDYWKTLVDSGLSNANEFKTNIAESAIDYSSYLKNAFDKIGVELIWSPSAIATERLFGFSVDLQMGKSKVTSVCMNSAADMGGLWYGDEILEVDGITVDKNVNFLIEATTTTQLLILRNGVQMELTLHSKPELPIIQQSHISFPENNSLFNYWIGKRNA
jgi:predicted metalloprotease with PDZ domain